MSRSKKRMAMILAVILILFMGIVLYMAYFQLFEANKLRDNSLNMRNWVDETKFGRGLFYDRNGEALVTREKEDDGTYVRYLNNPRMYAHIIGYNSSLYGKTGLEAKYNNYLLNLRSDNPVEQLRGQILDQGVGNNVVLTIDNRLQDACYSALESRDQKGAIVALNPKTGEILASVSYPSFNVNEVDENWNDLIEDDMTPLYNRALQGLYPPGSTMKAITATTLLETGIDLDYDDVGEETIDNYTFNNVDNEVFGEISLKEALIYSSNCYFVNKTKDIPEEQLQATIDRFMFNKEIPMELYTNASICKYETGMNHVLKASTCFGQGDVLVSPLHMAMIYGAIGNNGTMMKPYIVKSVKSTSGNDIYTGKSDVFSVVADAELLSKLKEYLVAMVDNNAEVAQVYGVDVAGKTGTAENEGENHSWFCCFAPAENPEIALAVILENGESGGKNVAGEILNYYFDNVRQ